MAYYNMILSQLSVQIYFSFRQQILEKKVEFCAPFGLSFFLEKIAKMLNVYRSEVTTPTVVTSVGVRELLSRVHTPPFVHTLPNSLVTIFNQVSIYLLQCFFQIRQRTLSSATSNFHILITFLKLLYSEPLSSLKVQV